MRSRECHATFRGGIFSTVGDPDGLRLSTRHRPASGSQRYQAGENDLRWHREILSSPSWAASIASWSRAPERINQIGRAHVRTPVTNAHLVCRLLLEKKNLTDYV